MYRSAFSENRPLVTGTIAHPESVIQRSGLYSVQNPALGIDGRVLIDTGSQISVIDREIAQELQLEEEDPDAFVVGIGGEQVPRRFIGSILLPESDILLQTTFYGIPLQERLGIEAAIGMDILSEFILTIHGPNGAITLARP